MAETKRTAPGNHLMAASSFLLVSARPVESALIYKHEKSKCLPLDNTDDDDHDE